MRNFQKFYISVLIILCLFLNNACSKAPEADSPFLSSFNQQEQQYYMVDIRGEVNRPGIYKVESGAMINDVIELAGGLTYQADLRYPEPDSHSGLQWIMLRHPALQWLP